VTFARSLSGKRIADVNRCPGAPSIVERLLLEDLKCKPIGREDIATVVAKVLRDLLQPGIFGSGVKEQPQAKSRVLSVGKEKRLEEIRLHDFRMLGARSAHSLNKLTSRCLRRSTN